MEEITTSAIKVPGTDGGGGLRSKCDRLPMAVEAIAMELPGHSGRTSWAYLIEDSDAGLHLIDCGADSERNRARLTLTLANRGRAVAEIASITATHTHFDHVGMAAWLRRESGATVQMHRRDACAMHEGKTYGGAEPEITIGRWGVPASRREEVLTAARRLVSSGEKVDIDRALEDGDALDVPGWDLVVVSTPGHTPGHICIVDRASGTAFVGDHVLPDQNPGPGLGGPTNENPVDAYLDSISRLGSLALRRLLPGHGAAIDQPEDRLATIVAHHARRRGHVVEAAGPDRTIWDTAASVRWSGGWDRLSGVLLFSALNQVENYLNSTVSYETNADGRSNDER